MTGRFAEHECDGGHIHRNSGLSVRTAGDECSGYIGRSWLAIAPVDDPECGVNIEHQPERHRHPADQAYDGAGNR